MGETPIIGDLKAENDIILEENLFGIF